jgi:hypothetical protein
VKNRVLFRQPFVRSDSASPRLGNPERHCSRQEVAGEMNTRRRKKSPKSQVGLLGLCEIERGAAFSAPGAPRPSSFRYADINCLNVECRCVGAFPRLLANNLASGVLRIEAISNG